MKKVLGVIGVMFLAVGFFVGNVFGETVSVCEKSELDGVVKITRTVTPDEVVTVDNKRLETIETEIAAKKEAIAKKTADYVAGHTAYIATETAELAVLEAEYQGAIDAGVTKLVVE